MVAVHHLGFIVRMFKPHSKSLFVFITINGKNWLVFNQV